MNVHGGPKQLDFLKVCNSYMLTQKSVPYIKLFIFIWSKTRVLHVTQFTYSLQF